MKSLKLWSLVVGLAVGNIIERLRAFTREISEIREDNRVYWMHSHA